jgi:hypothetical protein
MQKACHMCWQVRVETDPSDRTQMRLTVASQDPNVTYEYNFFPIPFTSVGQLCF